MDSISTANEKLSGRSSSCWLGVNAGSVWLPGEGLTAGFGEQPTAARNKISKMGIKAIRFLMNKTPKCKKLFAKRGKCFAICMS